MSVGVLVVDDDAGVRFLLTEALRDAGYRVEAAEDGERAWARLLGAPPVDLVLSDYRMPGLDGLGLLARVTQMPRPPRFLLLTAHGDERTAVAAMRAGAWDYVRKPFDLDELLVSVGRAVEVTRLTAEAERAVALGALGGGLVVASDAMLRLGALVARVGPRDVTVLITGESGTGKERIAEAIVSASPRADRPFVRFNCASLGPELAEAELFGHAKGAFTGAGRERPGLFREADGGTILLDEVGELAPVVQARLLRALQSGEVRPVGEDRATRVDVRVLAATHRDLAAMVAAGTFREDLLYRLKVVHLRVPPLRERPEEIPALVRAFVQRAARRFGMDAPTVDAASLARLAARTWPGNVRELENAAEMLVALSDGRRLDLDLLDDTVADPDPPPSVGDLRSRVDAYEKGLVEAALHAADGNRSAAARALGIGRVTLYEKLRRHGLG